MAVVTGSSCCRAVRAEVWENEAEVWSYQSMLMPSLTCSGNRVDEKRTWLGSGSCPAALSGPVQLLPGTSLQRPPSRHSGLGAAVERFNWPASLCDPPDPQSNFPDLDLTVCPADHRVPRHVVEIAPLPCPTSPSSLQFAQAQPIEQAISNCPFLKRTGCNSSSHQSRRSPVRAFLSLDSFPSFDSLHMLPAVLTSR